MEGFIFFNKDFWRRLLHQLSLTRISHQTPGKFEASVSPLHPRSSLGKVYEPSLRKLLGTSKKQNVQPPSRASEKYRLSFFFMQLGFLDEEYSYCLSKASRVSWYLGCLRKWLCFPRSMVIKLAFILFARSLSSRRLEL